MFDEQIKMAPRCFYPTLGRLFSEGNQHALPSSSHGRRQQSEKGLKEQGVLKDRHLHTHTHHDAVSGASGESGAGPGPWTVTGLPRASTRALMK